MLCQFPFYGYSPEILPSLLAVSAGRTLQATLLGCKLFGEGFCVELFPSEAHRGLVQLEVEILACYEEESRYSRQGKVMTRPGSLDIHPSLGLQVLAFFCGMESHLPSFLG